jgi:ribosomal peptide maturation radical SAM protein 1
MKKRASCSLNPTTVEAFRVALVCMPFHRATQPSIQIGLLQSLAERDGFPTDSYYFNLDLMARLGFPVYEALCLRHVTGEWLFSIAAFQNSVSGDDEAYYMALPQERAWADEFGKESVRRLRHELIPDFIENCLSLVNWGRYRVVGFSSTFQQHLASLALARRIKERWPEVITVFGGANMEDEMGLEHLRAFSCIDYAVLGEADASFPELLRTLAQQAAPEDIAGVAMRRDGGVWFTGRTSPFDDLDRLPSPNYDSYFDRISDLAQVPGERRIPFEGSRGCWWGQKHHCTFCGLNGRHMKYRNKSPQRALAELSELALRYRVTAFQATDNVLPMQYLRDFFPTIIEKKTDFRFFCEVKANLTHEQIRTLYKGGVRIIQPGIESLSSHVLQLMRKGTTMLQNVRCLKWCRYYRMQVPWSILWGFPGETQADYRQALAAMRLISHLEPPSRCGRFWLERFSPYFDRKEGENIHSVAPETAYRFLYPSYVDLDKIAYFFDYEIESSILSEDYAETEAWVREWQQRAYSDEPDTLYYRRTPDCLFIDDNRGPERRGTHVFYGPLAQMYEYCSETMRTAPEVTAYLVASPQGYSYQREEIEAGLREFCRLGLMLSEDGQYLSLALPANPNW